MVCALAAGGVAASVPPSRVGGAGESALDSGIEGHIEIRPVRSVERAGVSNPGPYTLRPESPARYPRASTRSVVVAPRTFTRVDIIYDSGRR